MSDDLFQAIREGDSETVRRLVTNDPALAASRDEAGLSAVLTAVYRHRRGDVVNALIDAQPELDVFDTAAVGATDRLAALLDTDPGLVDAYAADGFFPLGLAAYFAHPEAVRLLLARGAHVGAAARNAMAVQALHAAVAGRDPVSVDLLLGAGADPDARQHGGWTPLMAAAAHGDVSIVDSLLARGADASLVNDAGQDAARLAAENGHDALAERLTATWEAGV